MRNRTPRRVKIAESCQGDIENSNRQMILAETPESKLVRGGKNNWIVATSRDNDPVPKFRDVLSLNLNERSGTTRMFGS